MGVVFIVQQDVVAQVLGVVQRMGTLQQVRAAHDENLLVHYQHGIHARIDTAAQTDRDVDAVAGEIAEGVAGVEPHIEFRVPGAEAAKAGYQPACRKGW